MADVDDWDDLDEDDDSAKAQRRRALAAVEIPSTITASQILMYVQAASPLAVILGAIASTTAENAAQTSTSVSTTTTTTVPEEGAGGSVGGFLISAAAFITMVVLLVIFGTRLRTLRPTARTAAVTLEAILLPIAVWQIIENPLFGAILAPAAAAVIVLLYLPQSTLAFRSVGRAVGGGDRFDIRNLGAPPPKP